MKSRRREKCFDLGTNRHRKKSLVRIVQTFPPRDTSTRLPRARTLYSFIYTLSALPILSVLLSSHFSAPSPRCPFSTLPLLRAVPSPRRPFFTPTLLRAAPSPRRPFSTPSLLRADPRSAFAPFAQPSLPSLSLRPLRSAIRPIRLIRFQKKIIRAQRNFLSDSCANSPSKLSPALYKPHAKAFAIPLKSRKTQIFSNFLSQSLARFRKSPYFCTR